MSSLEGLGNPAPWMKEAACLGIDRNIFFVEGKNSWLMLQAKLICIGDKEHNECPVRLQCLQYSMRDQWGVFGGTSPHERARLKRAIKRGASILQEIQKIDKATRQRAQFLERRKEKNLVAYSQEAQDREDCLNLMMNYLDNGEEHTAREIAHGIGRSTELVSDTIRIARGRGNIEPGTPQKRPGGGRTQRWRAKPKNA